MEDQRAELSEPELPKGIEGKDELNLAEFPLSAIADRLPTNQKTLTFEDRVFDTRRGEMVTRQLTITASDQYGLPTALDDEVILGFVQLSKRCDFTERKVSFTRYQLLRLLGWSDDSKSYERLEKSLNRWVGVTLYYRNAWWSKERQCWVNEKFHVLDNVTLFEREHFDHDSAGVLSSFTWNDVLFRSFGAGNLKSIDFDLLKSLEGAVAKRLYRFLDKRFFHRPRWEFNLKEVSWEHIGLSRNYGAANLKRALLPTIRELERRGFLKPFPEFERFRKVRSGEWRVVFERGKAVQIQPVRVTEGEDQVLVHALVERVVTPSTAMQTVAAHSAERIRSQLEVFDWLLARRDPKVSLNPAGFLIASIKSEFTPPKGFLSREEQARREAQAKVRSRRAEERSKEHEAKETAQQQARAKIIQEFWQTLSEEARDRLQSEAIAQANPLERDLVERAGAFAEAARQSLLDAYALKLMQQAA